MIYEAAPPEARLAGGPRRRQGRGQGPVEWGREAGTGVRARDSRNSRDSHVSLPRVVCRLARSVAGFPTSLAICRTSKLVKSYQSSSVIRQLDCARHSALFNRRLITICYGRSIVAEQQHVIKSWTSRVKHPKRRSQHITT